MPDPIADITLGASTIGVPSPLSGSIDIDTTTGLLVSSTLQLDVGGVQVPLLDLALSTNSATGVTTVTANTLASGLGTGVTLSFTGTNPPTVTTSIAALGASLVNNTVSATTVTVCYCSGTLIRTARGDIAVECLVAGDLVVTASGERRPIRWLDSRTLDPRRHPRPHEVQPVRVHAHAFGANRPARDLRVSPGHALCLDLMGEVLVPAGALVNGATITRDNVDTVTYWHVELDSHDILLAENMPAESYLDMGNRGFFAGAGVVDFVASPDGDAVLRTHADFCRPFHDAGPVVEVARAQLRRRAAALGWRLEEQGLGDLHLVADGVRIEPVVRGLTARFTLPAGAQDVWLVSASARPCDVGDGSDMRRLGVGVGALAINDGIGPERRMAMDGALLDEGWHGTEGEAGRPLRWTVGRARLPADLWTGDGEGCYLRVELAFAALPRWVVPEAERAANPAASPLLAGPNALALVG